LSEQLRVFQLQGTAGEIWGIHCCTPLLVMLGVGR
jgi:hypothetical protein